MKGLRRKGKVHNKNKEKFKRKPSIKNTEKFGSSNAKSLKRKHEIPNRNVKRLKKGPSYNVMEKDKLLHHKSAKEAVQENIGQPTSSSSQSETSSDKTENELGISAFSDDDDDSDQYEENDIKSNELLLDETGENKSSDEDTFEDDQDLEKPIGEEDYELEGTDPFMNHFKYLLHPDLVTFLQSSSSISQEIETWPILRTVRISLPSCPEAKTSNKDFKKLLEDEVTYSVGAVRPKIPNLKEVVPRDLYIKSEIAKNLKTANPALNEATDETKFLTEFQNELFTVMNNYQDLLFTKQTLNNTDSVRFVYTMHLVNHIIKARTRIMRHNLKIKNNGNDDVCDEYRDQGFVRPKILILLPFKSSAYKVICLLMKLLFQEGKKGSVMNKKRFLEEYAGDSLRIPVRKPQEYKDIFSGNTDDDFTMGISITRKALKLYSEYYSSDIIIASPLSLRRRIGAKGDKDRDYDFLSSIEILILDQADIFLMQNWLHITHIFKHLHLNVQDHKKPDYSRVRNWSLEGLSKFYRQTMIFSSVHAPLHEALLNNYCHNYAGKVVVKKFFSSGAISNIQIDRQHDFYKFSAEIPTDIPEKRFQCFMQDIFPLFENDQSMRQVLIYIPGYSDFVKVRNHFMKECINFMLICDTSPWRKVAEARDKFYNEDVRFLLYTERYHFFNRITLKGIRHIVFYDLPTYPHYYSEICDMMHDGHLKKSRRCLDNFTVSALYTKLDYHKLVPIVGTTKAKNMISSDKNLHKIFLPLEKFNKGINQVVT